MMNNFNFIFRNLINFNRGRIASSVLFWGTCIVIMSLFSLFPIYGIIATVRVFELLLNSLIFIVLFYLIIIIILGFVLFNNLQKFSIKNNIVYDSKYGKLLFEANLGLKISIGPLSIILCKLILINFIYNLLS